VCVVGVVCVCVWWVWCVCVCVCVLDTHKFQCAVVLYGCQTWSVTVTEGGFHITDFLDFFHHAY